MAKARIEQSLPAMSFTDEILSVLPRLIGSDAVQSLMRTFGSHFPRRQDPYDIAPSLSWRSLAVYFALCLACTVACALLLYWRIWGMVCSMLLVLLALGVFCHYRDVSALAMRFARVVSLLAGWVFFALVQGGRIMGRDIPLWSGCSCAPQLF